MPNAVKEKIISDLSEEIKKSEHIVITDYQGLNAEEFTELRTSLNKIGAKYKVVKNRLAKIALKNIDRNVDEYLKGPSAFAYEGPDAATLTKLLFSFGKKHTNLKVKAGYMFGQVTDQASLKALSELPSKEVLLATLLARMNAPLQKLAATMNEPIRSLHAALSAVVKNKEAAPAA